MQTIRLIYYKLKELLFLPILCLLLLVLSFCFESPKVMFNGYADIMLSPSILLTDYFAVGGMGATFFNAATTDLYLLGC